MRTLTCVAGLVEEVGNLRKRTKLTKQGEVCTRLVGDIVRIASSKARCVCRLEVVPRNHGVLNVDAGLRLEPCKPDLHIGCFVLAVRCLTQRERDAFVRLVASSLRNSDLLSAAATRSGYKRKHRKGGSP